MAALRVAVATSGGLDSTALLHCTLRAAAPLNMQVLALHVHHGLLPAADQWLHQVQAQSKRWGAQFVAQSLRSAPEAGDSVEAWARRERYRALTEMALAADCHLVLLAHHRRDQAETWLLQALRGAGPLGLSAMPQVAQRGGVTWARPWLDCPRSQIDAYARRHRLRAVEDPSNSDPRFARSRLRGAVWPALLAAFPDAEIALAQAAARAQDTAAVLAEVMAADLPALEILGGLNVPAWLLLTSARRRVTLRAWLEVQLNTPVPGSLVQRLAKELPATRSARWPAGAHELRLYRGVLKLKLIETPLQQQPVATGEQAHASPLNLAAPGSHRVAGWAGHLEVREALQGGVAAAALHGVRALPRAGGERFQHASSGIPRSLKKQYQTVGVAAWQRHGPLLFGADGGLLFVPGLGVDARRVAPPGVLQMQLRWVPAADRAASA